MAKRKENPVAFLSYVNGLDDIEDKRITELADRLSKEVSIQTGLPFHIFQDRKDIKWGQTWQQVIDNSIETVTFLIPIIAPHFFNSKACRDELETFWEKEKKLKRNDLVMPIYYVTADELEDENERNEDKLAQKLHTRQFIDWRQLRLEPFGTPAVSKEIASIASQLVTAIKRLGKDDGKAKAEVLIVKAAKNTTSQNAETESPSASTAAILKETKKVPTLIVDQMHRGDYITINEAIKNAVPGTKIMVRPGTYNEAIVIDKPLELIGDGNREHITIQKKDNSTIIFTANMGRITNFTIKQLGGAYSGISIRQGRLDVEDCDITSNGIACIAVFNWADPRIRRNKIHGGLQSGIFVYENGLGLIEENDIFENTFSGIEVSDASAPIIRNNTIRECKGAGLYIYLSAKPVIESNDIFNNSLSGIYTCESAEPVIKNNKIHNCNESGISITKDAKGMIDSNIITDNLKAGIEVRENSNPVVKNNIIHNNKYNAIWIFNKGKGLYENNDLTNNGSGPWDISADSKALVTRNNNKEK